ncbi:hypothetical protein QYF36_016452 [Acer negundo]|nr:hypothetical protein QYF36_016452 [Acer negundo]
MRRQLKARKTVVSLVEMIIHRRSTLFYRRDLWSRPADSHEMPQLERPWDGQPKDVPNLARIHNLVEPLLKFTEESGEASKYRGFLYQEYHALRMRNKTHPPAKPKYGIHITHYAITS